MESQSPKAGRQEVSTRALSHNTTGILRDLEAIHEPMLVTRHNRIIAALIPADLSEIASRWFDTKTSTVRAVNHALAAPKDSPRASRLLGARHRAKSMGERSAPAVTEIGVRKFSQSTSQVLRAVEQGEIVLIRRRSNVVAVLVPFNLTDLAAGRLDHSQNVAEAVRELVKNPPEFLSQQQFMDEVRRHTERPA